MYDRGPAADPVAIWSGAQGGTWVRRSRGE
jgi:hypothetical protein